MSSLPPRSSAEMDCAAYGGGYIEGTGFYGCVPDTRNGLFVRATSGVATLTTTKTFTTQQEPAIAEIMARHLQGG